MHSVVRDHVYDLWCSEGEGGGGRAIITLCPGRKTTMHTTPLNESGSFQNQITCRLPRKAIVKQQLLSRKVPRQSTSLAEFMPNLADTVATENLR